jgi:hypothetical protein
MLPAVDAGCFRARMRAFGTVTACRVIGDENTFVKFMARQCFIGNNESQQLQDGVSALQRVHDALAETERMLDVGGLSRISSVMREMRTAPFALGRCDILGVCALSGRVSSDFVIVRGTNAHMLVDARYAPFLQSLWMLWHAADVETARVEAYLDEQGAGGSIRGHIQSFLENAAMTEDEAGVYFEAYEHVRATLLPVVQAAGGP